MQKKVHLEKFYMNEDPWGYKTNPSDLNRKKIIIETIKKYGPFNKALDISCGEGFVTESLPAKEVYGFDLSKRALDRLPENVIRVDNLEWQSGKYDLVCNMGSLYKQYDIEWLIKQINRLSSNIILITGIKDWLKGLEKIDGELIYEKEFEYYNTRNYTQRILIFKKK